MRIIRALTPERLLLMPPSRFVYTDAVDNLLHWASEGSYRTAVLSGPPRFGKSLVARSFAHAAWHFTRVLVLDEEDISRREDFVTTAMRALERDGPAHSGTDLVIVDDADMHTEEADIDASIAAINRLRNSPRWLLTLNSDAREHPLPSTCWVTCVQKWQCDDARRHLQEELAARHLTYLVDWNEVEKMHQVLDAETYPPEIAIGAIETFLATGSAAAAVEYLQADAAQQVTGVTISPDLTTGRLSVMPVLREKTVALRGTDGRLGAVPLLRRPRIRNMFADALEEFEHLVNEEHTSEADLQDLFERYPRLIGGADYRDVVAQPVLHRAGESPLIPDFMLAPADGGFADILDLKLPGERLIVGRPNRARFSQVVADALAQVREYRNYFDERDYRQDALDRYGLRAYRPKLTVVIGRLPKRRDPLAVRRVWDDLPRAVDDLTYDQLIARARLWEARAAW